MRVGEASNPGPRKGAKPKPKAMGVKKKEGVGSTQSSQCTATHATSQGEVVNQAPQVGPEAVAEAGGTGGEGSASSAGQGTGGDPQPHIFWDPLGEEFAGYPGAIGNPGARPEVLKDPTKLAESLALAQTLQKEEDAKRQEELIDRASAQLAQDEADANTTAADWISFFQQPADHEVPDICQDIDQYVWRSSGSGSASGIDQEQEECYCGAICRCLRRHQLRSTHRNRSSLKASWIRARKELKEAEGNDRTRRECLGRHPGIETTALTEDDEEAWEAYFLAQIRAHEERVRELREQGLSRVGLGSQFTLGGNAQGPIDLTQEATLASQETVEGLPPIPGEDSEAIAGAVPGGQDGDQQAEGRPPEWNTGATHHKASQTEDQAGYGKAQGNQNDQHSAANLQWKEGYEAARRVIRQYFQELHQAQNNHRTPGWIWLHLSEEMTTRTGPSEENRPERASGSTDHRGSGHETPGQAGGVGRHDHLEAEASHEGTESRKRNRSQDEEDIQEPVPMEVDQEGEAGGQESDDHGTEEENLQYADQLQYSAAPAEGWNHEGSIPQKGPKGTKTKEGKLDIRLEMLQLALRIVEATTAGGAEGRANRHTH